ncbi:simple sugar transport system ATP-binding protein [Paucibacter oligotrophus]|uniref:Simple sugar transport system ATP-binding protein n=1 Tax=Roseateles oligotrophus TaxID=1769250 RepID=A0A840LCK4_9BURK|nr:ABC transporter ATP-binding protein [Roseateles oligotrophus]MBB4843918.1 simple sugar transport system ATP-binding protein [Roseateles oligotrophus]
MSESSTANHQPAASTGRSPAVRLLAISKRFGAVQANREVNLTIEPGTVHGLVGENGAGKSTLMAILYGYYQADAGQIEVGGRPVQIHNSHQAIDLGLGMVHQHFMLVDTLSCLDNIMLGAEGGFLLARSKAKARAKLELLMAESGLHVHLDALVGDLPVGELQRLEILKALYRGAKVLILDEPTAVLTPQETLQLFETLRRLKEKSGTTIVLITHKLKEVMSLCDTVTVMRAGQVVQTTAISDTSPEALAEAMVGRKVNLGRKAGARPSGEQVRLRATGLSLRADNGVETLKDVSLALHAGEIVGVAGVSGNGQTELLELLSGMLAPQAGRLTLAQAEFDAASGPWLTPARARELKLAHVPEDRLACALVKSFPAWETAVLGYQQQPAYRRGLSMDHGRMRAQTAQMQERFDVRPRDVNLGSSKFSGGNQQKLVLAREIGQAPSVLLVGQPTRGVDIGAIEFIHQQLRGLRDAGCAVLLVSSELDEILALADRVIVMNSGRITGELGIEDCDEKKLGLLMASQHETAQAEGQAA